MKATVLIACLLVIASGASAASLPSAAAPGPWPRHEAARPLLRYLIATLHLPDGQALEVQQVLKAHPLGTLTPVELANLLFPVLTEGQFTKFQDLADSEMLGPNMQYLASLH